MLDGDLVITEIMFDPDFGSDASSEWIEVLNASGGSVDLNGLVIMETSGSDGEITESVVIGAGEYAVLGISTGDSFAYTFDVDGWYGSLFFGNGGDDISLWNGDMMIDMAANYGGMGVGAGNHSGSTPPCEDSASNDDVTSGVNFDEIADADGDMGTPGVTGVCFEEEEVLGTCEDTDGGLGICASFFDADPRSVVRMTPFGGIRPRWRCTSCGGGTTEGGGDDPIDFRADTGRCN